MASKGIYQYTVQESNNAGLGQGGSVFLNNASTTFTPDDGVIIAIQALGDDVTLDTLTPENTEKHIGTATTDLGYEGKGNTSTTYVIPSGSTIFGRFTSVSLADTKPCICYIG
tara:strand:+ start:136 stop:474 length:339 start_codon:yes stop_codon:yes gene_type:complete